MSKPQRQLVSACDAVGPALWRLATAARAAQTPKDKHLQRELAWLQVTLTKISAAMTAWEASDGATTQDD